MSDKNKALVPNETTELEVVQPSPFAVMNLPKEELQELLTMNLGDNGGLSMYDLDRVKMPSGGSTVWEVPTLQGPVDTKSVEGIIIFWKETRGYWAKRMEETGGGTPPDCSSDDAKWGIANQESDTPGPGGDCSKCPLAQFGSAQNGDGQACKLVRHLFILGENSILPMVVGISPASNKVIRQYFMRLAQNGLPYFGVKTRLTLEKAESGGGIKYAKAVATMVDRFTPEQIAQLRAYHNSIKPALERVEIVQEYVGE